MLFVRNKSKWKQRLGFGITWCKLIVNPAAVWSLNGNWNLFGEVELITKMELEMKNLIIPRKTLILLSQANRLLALFISVFKTSRWFQNQPGCGGKFAQKVARNFGYLKWNIFSMWRIFCGMVKLRTALKVGISKRWIKAFFEAFQCRSNSITSTFIISS